MIRDGIATLLLAARAQLDTPRGTFVMVLGIAQDAGLVHLGHARLGERVYLDR